MIFFKKKTIITDKEKSLFTIFEREKTYYYDSACVTLKPKTVVNKLLEYYDEYPACAGRSTHKLSSRVSKEVLNARKKVQRFFNAQEMEEIIFTKNTTESINLLAYALEDLLRGRRVLITDKEHNSNYLPWVRLEEKGVVKTQIITCKKTQIDLKELDSALNKRDVALLSIHYASNIDGSMQDIKKIITLAHKYGTLVLVDAAQAAAHTRIDVRTLDVDFLVCSGHKMYGPSGIGILYAKKNLLKKMNPFIIGGDTVADVHKKKYVLLPSPNKFEAGLQDYAGIIAMGEAITFLEKNWQKIAEHTDKSLEVFFEELAGQDIQLLSHKKNNCGIFTFIPRSINAQELAIMLSEQNICVRAGNFCSHNWFNTYKQKDAIRFSLSLTTTPEDTKKVCSIIKKFL